VIPNFQMIHIASELVALVGITFYFTSKHNSVMSEIKKLQNVVQKQQTVLTQYDQKIANLTKIVEKLQLQVRKPPIIQDNFGPFNGPHMFDDFQPADVLGHMMGGPLGPMFGGRPPPSSDNMRSDHNIHIVPDDSAKKDPTEAVETDSQLDAQLSDELAELQSNASNSNANANVNVNANANVNSAGNVKLEELPVLGGSGPKTTPLFEQTDLNAERSNNNSSVLSINDA